MTLPDLLIGWAVIALVGALLFSAAMRHFGRDDNE